MKPHAGSAGLRSTARYRFELFPRRRFTHVSDSITAMTGYTPAEHYADPDLGRKLVHPDDAQILADFASGARDPESPVLLRWIARDGRTLWTEHVMRAERDFGGQIAAIEGEVHDVTGSLADAGYQAALAEAIAHSQEGVVITDAAGAITYANPAFVQRSGYSLDELLGQNPRILKSGVHSTAFYHRMWRRLASGRSFSGGFVNRRKDGTLFREGTIITPYRDDSGRIAGYVAIKRDTTSEDTAVEALALERAERSRVLAELAGVETSSDAITVARQVCDVLVGSTGVHAAAVVAFDPDGARSLVGRRGDGAWSLPQKFAAHDATRLRGSTDSGPWVRPVGEPIPGSLANAAIQAGIGLVGAVPLRTNGVVPGILVIGTPSDDPDVADRLQSALAEYRPILSQLLVGPLKRRAEINVERLRIHEIIRTHAFEPVFQPIVDLVRGTPIGHELLTRFADGNPPDRQFAAAHAAGLEAALEIATLDAGIDAARSLPAGSWLSINVSPELLMDAKKLRPVLERADRPIVLELTEHRAVSDYARLQVALRELPSGVSLAVDDAGAGYASFRHILELRPAYVKIDAGIVHGIASDAARRSLVAGFRYFADQAGCEPIAEGVETVAERQILRQLGIILGQGYLLGRPAPAAASSEGAQTRRAEEP